MQRTERVIINDFCTFSHVAALTKFCIVGGSVSHPLILNKKVKPT